MRPEAATLTDLLVRAQRGDPQAWNEAAKESYYKQDYRPMRNIIAGAIVKREHKNQAGSDQEQGGK